MKTYSTVSILLSSLLGFAIYLTFAWQEWQKLTGVKQSLRTYITDDVPGFVAAVLLTIASYVVLPELGELAWARETFGFTPRMTPMSALAASFLFAVLGYQWRAIFMGRFGAGK